MGYELWTSPTTGYRRRGTRLADFDAAFGQTICASAIYEPLKSCPAAAPAREMARILRSRDFDIAGVREFHLAPISGFVRRASLTNGCVMDHIEELDGESVIDDFMTIQPLLDVLRKKPFVFVRVGDEITGIITAADLNKPIVRVYLFGLISLLEIHLSFWLRQAYRDEEWHDALGATRVAAAELVQAERRRRGQQLALIEVPSIFRQTHLGCPKKTAARGLESWVNKEIHSVPKRCGAVEKTRWHIVSTT